MAVETIRNEDFVEYFLFPKLNECSEEDERDALNKLSTKINNIASDYTKSYIWHKDSFGLKVRTRNSHLLKTEDKGKSDSSQLVVNLS
jgi:hypothetical protein